MTSLSSAGQNTSAKASKIPVAIPNTNAGEGSSTSQAMKPPLESRKSGEELKLRLASAVSAKIALGKDGRTSPSANTRGQIGYLLQRKQQQQENKLNTKDISFQKLTRNEGGKTAETASKETNSSTAKNVRNKAVLQKSLLSALMNSRAPSGTGPAQNRVKNTQSAFPSKLNSSSTGINSPSVFNKAPLSTPKATSKTVVNKPKKDVNLAVENNKTGQSGSINGKTNVTNENVVNGRKRDVIRGMATSKMSNISNTDGKNKPTSEMVEKPQMELSNGNGGGILERAKNIERLLGQRKQPNSSVQQTISKTNITSDGTNKITKPNREETTNTTNGELKMDRTAITSKRNENGKGIKMAKNTTKELGSAVKQGNKVLNGAGFKSNNTTEGKGSVSDEIDGKSGANNTAESKKPLANFGKKIPPPVSKKPSREDLPQIRSKQNPSPFETARKDGTSNSMGNTYSNIKPPSQKAARIPTNGNSSKMQGKIGASKVEDLNSNNETLNGTYSGKYTTFTENLLEKLEADVANCKIAAFQSTEDFSVLRMKVYRIRGELDQLRREREKRKPLVC